MSLFPRSNTPDARASQRSHLAAGSGFRQGLLACLVVLLILSAISVFVGTRTVSPQTTLDAIIAFDSGNSEHLLVQHLRIPRTILAIIVGAALGVAGVIMQALTRNPLADPGILGVNAGATLAIVIAIAFFGISHIAGYMWFGLLGSAIAGIGVYFLAGIGQGVNPVRVVLAGAALSVVLMAMTHIVLINSPDQVFDQFRHWAVGSLQGRGKEVIVPVALLILFGLAGALTLSKALDTVSLGDDLGTALGTDPLRVWILSSVVIVMLSGAATAAAGPISFVGLTAPHLARFVVGPDHKKMMPYAILFSAILVLAADILGRIIGQPGEIGVGIMVALVGGPFFVLLVRRWRIAQL